MTDITITGRATGDAELRFTSSGAAVANFTVAVNHRKFNKQAGEWEDDGASFYRCQVWNQKAEAVAEAVLKGTAVMVTGELRERQWEDRQTGQKRSAFEVRASEVGLTIIPGRNGQQRPQQQAQGGWGKQGQGADPWAAPGGAEPPF